MLMDTNSLSVMALYLLYGHHQTKESVMSHQVLPLPPNSPSPDDTISTTVFFPCRKRFPRSLHTKLPLIHMKIRGLTPGRTPKPSLEAHKDLKHFGSLRYMGTIALTHNSLKLEGLTLTTHKNE